MRDFYYRTEDIRPDKILKYFVEIEEDRDIVDALKGRNPSMLVGSRGTGKSFLLRVAEAELRRDFDTGRVFPVYATFEKSTLIQTSDPDQFTHWMLARLAANLVRSLSRYFPTFDDLRLPIARTDPGEKESRIELIAASYEDSWTHGKPIKISGVEVPSAESFKDAVEEICIALDIDRIAFFIDEAAHILLPPQQRQFFTIFRDLRSPYLTCNAAVYPGVTAFGDAFQRSHDATFLSLTRNVLAREYIDRMREVVEKQADSETLGTVARSTENFELLAYAASGNPRLLLKTLSRARNLSASEVNGVIRSFYRSEFWNDHTMLSDKYSPYKIYVDWGRDFLENDVLPKLRERSASGRVTTAYLYVDKNAPKAVSHALDLLEYTGILIEHEPGIRGTRSGVGTRFLVNLGTVFATLSVPTREGLPLVKGLSIKRFAEYGANYSSFIQLQEAVSVLPQDAETSPVLSDQLKKDIDILDITDWQKEKLRELDLTTLGDVLRATDQQLQEAYYVGEIRSRQMKNAAQAAVFEYLTG